MTSVALENARLYEELRENDRRKDEFLAMLAHELRNPLAAIGNATTLAARTGRPEQVQWGLDIVTRQVRHLTRLIDDLLDVSRITRGKIQLHAERLDAGPILQSAVQAVRPLIDQKRHGLEVSTTAHGLWVDADPVRLEQILTNLLTNAAKYTEPGGLVALSVRRAGDEVIFEVRDNGMGIPPEKLPMMFELFVQGDRSLARSEGGLGIGLTLVKRLAELHGGQVEASSAGPGRGSTFVVRLPAASAPTSKRPGHSEVTRAQRCRRILIVDDNRDTAQGLAHLLEILGHDVQIVHDGKAACERARRSLRNSSCSILACPAWTATRLPPGFATIPAARTPSSSPSRVTARRRTSDGRDTPASTIIWSSRSITTSCSRSSPRRLRTRHPDQIAAESLPPAPGGTMVRTQATSSHHSLSRTMGRTRTLRMATGP